MNSPNAESKKNPAVGIRLDLLIAALLLLCFAVLVELAMNMKLHLHIPLGESQGRKSYLNIRRNLNIAEIFQDAQKHDLSGQTELASEDFAALLDEPGFKELPERVKPTLQELVDCRRSMESADYFSELICHSRIGYWSKEQMPLKVYVPDQSKSDGFSPFDRTLITGCFDEWCAIVPGRLSYKLVESPNQADIVFSQKARLIDLSFSRSVLAHTIPLPSGPEKWAIFPASKAKIEPLRFQPDLKDKKDSRYPTRHTVILHEIGHALGLIGHSSNGADIMFFSGAPGLSPRDRQTFKRIYEDGSVYERAEKAMRSLAEKNDKYALLQLALQLEQNGIASPEQSRAVYELVKRAAELGSSKALLMLGWIYHDGNGCRRNLAEAARCFHAADRKGNSSALLALASVYERGDGDKQDLARAEKYLKLALRMDLTKAPIAYANFLSYAYGDESSLARAVGFYERNSEHGQSEGLSRLALLYEHGQGVPKDPAKARALRQRACSDLRRLKASDAREYYARACAYSEIAQYDKAIADYSQAVKLKGDSRSIYLGRAAALHALGKNKEACADLDKAIALDPDCIPAHLGRSYSRLGLGEPRAALEDVNAILSRTEFPDCDRLYALLLGASCHRLLNNEAAARRFLDEAEHGTNSLDWPGPIVRFLKNEITESDFLKEARGFSRATEVRFYLAVQQLLMGKLSEAKSNLLWVKNEGDRCFYEYPAAVGRLELLQKKSP